MAISEDFSLARAGAQLADYTSSGGTTHAAIIGGAGAFQLGGTPQGVYSTESGAALIALSDPVSAASNDFTVTFRLDSATSFLGLAVGLDVSSSSYYFAGINSSGGGVVYKYPALALLGSGGSAATGTTTTLRVTRDVVGSDVRIRAYFGGATTAAIDVTDAAPGATYTGATRVGIHAFGASSPTTGVRILSIVDNASAPAGLSLTGPLALAANTPGGGLAFTAPAASGGTGPYTYRLYRHTAAPFTPTVTGSLVATSSTTALTDASPSAGLAFYRATVADSLGAVTTSTQSAYQTALATRWRATPAKVLVIGDSILNGFLASAGADTCTRLQQALARDLPTRAVTVVNRALVGWTTTLWLPTGTDLAPALAAGAGADLCVLGLGMNDCKASGANLSAATYLANLGTIAAAIVASGIPRVLLIAPTAFTPPGPSNGWGEADLVRLAQYRDGLPSVANGTTILAGTTSLIETVLSDTSVLGPDGVHMTDAGYRMLAEAIAPGVLNVLTGAIPGGDDGGSYPTPGEIASAVVAAMANAPVGSVGDKAGFSLASHGLDAVAGWGSWTYPQTERAIAQFLMGLRTGVPQAGEPGIITFHGPSSVPFGAISVDTVGNITSNNMTPPA